MRSNLLGFLFSGRIFQIWFKGIDYTQVKVKKKDFLMTTFFNYDDMTWDAVAGLPRDTPLVLPLGSGYDLNLLARPIEQCSPHRTPASLPIRLARQWS